MDGIINTDAWVFVLVLCCAGSRAAGYLWNRRSEGNSRRRETLEENGE